MTLPAIGWVDWVLLALLSLSIAIGLWRGLLFEVLSLVGWVAAYIVAQAYASTVAPLLPVGVPGSALSQGAGFAVLFLLALVAWALASRLLRLLIHATPLQAIDRFLATHDEADDSTSIRGRRPHVGP